MITWDTVEAAAREMRPAFEKVCNNIDDGICLYGAGTFAPLCMDFLKEKGYKVLSFADSAKDKQNTRLCGLDVVAPASFTNGVFLITNQSYAQAIIPSGGGGAL
jgi:FlaA1/EpsC-like NDP-sugar epimerase